MSNTEITKEDIVVLCEQAIDEYEEGLQVKYLLYALYEVRAYLINERKTEVTE
jgi:hypothetical protein